MSKIINHKKKYKKNNINISGEIEKIKNKYDFIILNFKKIKKLKIVIKKNEKIKKFFKKIITIKIKKNFKSLKIKKIKNNQN